MVDCSLALFLIDNGLMRVLRNVEGRTEKIISTYLHNFCVFYKIFHILTFWF